jgi:hypothetical protein
MSQCEDVLYSRIMKGIHNRRWIALGADGRHITLGGYSDPSDDELAQLESELAREGSALGSRLPRATTGNPGRA